MNTKHKDSDKIRTEEWIKKVLDKFPENAEKYNYSKVVFTKSDDKVIIVCKQHGEFPQRAANHLHGQGCPKCGKTPKLTQEEWIAKAKAKHGDKYDYSKVVYERSNKKVIIICPEHGEFEQIANDHLQGCGCTECGKLSIAESRKRDVDSVLKGFRDVHGDKYDYSKVEHEYLDVNNKVTIICPIHGEFPQRPKDHLEGHGCPKCVPKISSTEQDCYEFIKQFCPDAVQSDRTVLEGKELDIYIPSKRLAVEINGIWWHNDKQRDKRYHFDKFVACKEKGVRLIQITDYEWAKDKVKFEKLLKHAIGVDSGRKVNARQCEVVELTAGECKDFYDAYHPQGHAANPVNIALKTKGGEIVAIMSFGFGKTTRGAGRTSGASKAVWELSRFATACVVRGGASRLFKAFVRSYNPEQVRSFSMNDWFSGGVYEVLGFTSEYVAPDYRVFHPKNGLRPKPHWQRRNIPKRLEEIGRTDIDFNPDKSVDPRTEFQIENMVGALRIWDSGKIRWTWKKH